MEKQFLKILSVSVLALFCACAPSEEEPQKQIQDGQILDPGSLQKVDNELIGTGRYRLNEIMADPISAKALELEVHLPNDGSFVEVIFFSDRPQHLNNGTILRLTRTGFILKGTLENNLTGLRNITPARLAHLNPANFSLIIEARGHANRSQIILYPQEITDPNNYFFNSDRPGDLDNSVGSSPMPGLFVGINLLNARITHGKLRNPVTP